MQEPKSLEDLTGLTELHAAAAALMEGMDADEDDDGAGLIKGTEKAAPAGEDGWETL